MKQVLIINASPRIGGNSETLSNAFKKGILRERCKINTISVGKIPIKGCIACNKCYELNKACCFDDNFSIIANLIEDSDVIVFSTPMYWYNFPTQMKSIIDKFYAFIIGKRDVSNKKSILLVCGELKDEKQYSPILDTYHQIIQELNWINLGEIIATDVFEIGDICGNKALELSEKLASKI